MVEKQPTTKEEFTHIYRTHAESLLAFVFYKVADKYIAEDIVADSFIKLWERLENGVELVGERALLYTIARGLIIDHYRRQSKCKSVPIEDVIDTLLEEGSLVVDADNKNAIKEVISVMKDIKPDYSEILRLHYLDDFSITEISHILGESENNLRVRMHRALEAVRKKIYHEKL